MYGICTYIYPINANVGKYNILYMEHMSIYNIL